MKQKILARKINHPCLSCRQKTGVGEGGSLLIVIYVDYLRPTLWMDTESEKPNDLQNAGGRGRLLDDDPNPVLADPQVEIVGGLVWSQHNFWLVVDIQPDSSSRLVHGNDQGRIVPRRRVNRRVGCGYGRLGRGWRSAGPRRWRLGDIAVLVYDYVGRVPAPGENQCKQSRN